MTFLPTDAVIPQAKLTQYLLIPLPKDDKSQYLAQAGYTLDNWQQLEQDLRNQVLTQPAKLAETNRYGTKYLIRATLKGANGVSLKVVTVWIVTRTTTRFVTLVPDKGGHP
jgi:hypothetical protein